MSGQMRLNGVAASIGVAIGPARVLRSGQRRLSFGEVDAEAVDEEVARFEEAVARSRSEIETAKQELVQRHGATSAPILDVYLLMHGDALLIDAVVDTIRGDRVNAEWAVARVAERLRAPLLRDSSTYFRERARDIDHVEEHLLRHLCGDASAAVRAGEPVILVARDLTPADAVRLLAPPTLGLVTELGAGSSHTAILARTFGVPAVVGVGSAAAAIHDGDQVLVDGFTGEVGVGIPQPEVQAAEARRSRYLDFLRKEREGRSVTQDGTPIAITTNVELPTEVEAAFASGAEGIGLYRTEFMCLDRSEPPSEDEQLDVYRSVVTAMAPKGVVFRTFDLRGDKRLRADGSEERQRQWLETQIKAVLRASGEGTVSLMFPMVATLEELRAAKALVQRCRAELSDDTARAARLPIGMMVEVPAAALMAEHFAREADFFAVGTNDLAHHTLALDRGRSGPSASPLDPAVLRLMSSTLAAAETHGIPCSVCGDVAAEPLGLVLVLGLGFRTVSVPVSVVPLAAAVVRSLDLEAARAAAAEALACDSAEAVRELVRSRFARTLDPPWEAD